MKTTVEIPDQLLDRARTRARHDGTTLRSLIEQGLRHVLEQPQPRRTYHMDDCRVGNADARNPLEQMSWPELRDEIYGEHT